MQKQIIQIKPVVLPLKVAWEEVGGLRGRSRFMGKFRGKFRGVRSCMRMLWDSMIQFGPLGTSGSRHSGEPPRRRCTLALHGPGNR